MSDVRGRSEVLSPSAVAIASDVALAGKDLESINKLSQLVDNFINSL